MKTILTRWLPRMAVGSLLFAGIVPLMQWCFDSHVLAHELLVNYCFALVYAFCIGSILTATVGVVWARTCRWNTLLRWGARALLISAATAAGTAIAGLVPLATYGRQYGYWTSLVGSFKIGMLISVVSVAFVSMYEKQKSVMQATAMELKTKEVERERALKLATEARLSSLESRIHPHFLFNTINSISSLMHEDPQRAERLLMQMAALLRFSLDSAHAGLVPLEREIRIVEDYLEIEKARFGDRLRYELEAPRSVQDAPVPPLALQTLVENSVKFAVASRGSGATVFISVRRNGERVELEVRDDGPGFRDLELPAGHGLNNLQERLVALFGESGTLDVESSSEGSSVRISIPASARAAGLEMRPRASTRL